MPVDLVKVERVDACPTANPQVMSHLVTGMTVEDQPRTVQFQTIKVWDASLCRESGRLGRYVWIWSKQSRYGFDIVKVAPDTSKWEHSDDQPAA